MYKRMLRSVLATVFSAAAGLWRSQRRRCDAAKRSGRSGREPDGRTTPAGPGAGGSARTPVGPAVPLGGNSERVGPTPPARAHDHPAGRPGLPARDGHGLPLGWHFIDLVTAIPRHGDSLMVTLFGEPIVVVREDDEDVRAYRCLRRPRGAPQPVRCAIRYGMIFVNLDQRDHQLVEPETITATPRSA